MSSVHHSRQEPRRWDGKPAVITERVLIGTDPHELSTTQAQLLILGLAFLAAAGLVVWLLVGNHEEAATKGEEPTLVSRAQLAQLAESVDHPVYWAGPRQGFSYELTSTRDGRVFVRYLPKGVTAGDPRPNFLVVGTYSRTGSFGALKRAANMNGSVWVDLPNKGLMVASTKPQSVYIGYPGAKYQIEVFSPVSDLARKLVLQRTIVPIR
jgi:hypothetical protein